MAKRIPILYPELRYVTTDWILSQAADAIVNGDAEPACDYDPDPVIGSALSLHDAGIITLTAGWRNYL